MARTVPDSVLQLAADLKGIREAKGLSVADVSRAMSQGADVIESIERSLLMDNPVFNPIYLRPMLRKYGQKLGLDEDRFLHAVDRAYQGTYEADWRDRQGEALPEVQPTARPIVVPEKPVLQYELEPVRTPRKRFEFGSGSAKGLMRGLLVFAVVAVLGALGWMAFQFISTLEFPAPSAEEASVPQDVQEQDVAPAPPPAIVLPERITLIIQADTLPVRGLRVQLDRDARRPYWIEPRQARTFSFADSVRLFDAEAGTGQLGRISVTVEGRALPARHLTGRETVLRRAELPQLLAP